MTKADDIQRLVERIEFPTPAEMEMHLLRHPEDADYVVQMPGRGPVSPEEIWIEGLGVWLRTDGSYASADRARGGKHYTGEDRDRLARISAYWKAARITERTDDE